MADVHRSQISRGAEIKDGHEQALLCDFNILSDLVNCKPLENLQVNIEGDSGEALKKLTEHALKDDSLSSACRYAFTALIARINLQSSADYNEYTGYVELSEPRLKKAEELYQDLRNNLLPKVASKDLMVSASLVAQAIELNLCAIDFLRATAKGASPALTHAAIRRYQTLLCKLLFAYEEHQGAKMESLHEGDVNAKTLLRPARTLRLLILLTGQALAELYVISNQPSRVQRILLRLHRRVFIRSYERKQIAAVFIGRAWPHLQPPMREALGESRLKAA